MPGDAASTVPEFPKIVRVEYPVDIVLDEIALSDDVIQVGYVGTKLRLGDVLRVEGRAREVVRLQANVWPEPAATSAPDDSTKTDVHVQVTHRGTERAFVITHPAPL